METAVGVDAALLVQLASQLLVVGKKFADLALPSPGIDVQPVYKVGSQAAASPDDPRAGLCPANNPLPLLLENRQQAVSEPVHVIQQHETGKRPLVFFSRKPWTESVCTST